MLLGLCPPPDLDDELDRGSTVEQLKDPIPALFDVLTEQQDIQERWSSYTFVIDLNLIDHSSEKASQLGIPGSKTAGKCFCISCSFRTAFQGPLH